MIKETKYQIILEMNNIIFLGFVFIFIILFGMFFVTREGFNSGAPKTLAKQAEIMTNNVPINPQVQNIISTVQNTNLLPIFTPLKNELEKLANDKELHNILLPVINSIKSLMMNSRLQVILGPAMKEYQQLLNNTTFQQLIKPVVYDLQQLQSSFVATGKNVQNVWKNMQNAPTNVNNNIYDSRKNTGIGYIGKSMDDDQYYEDEYEGDYEDDYEDEDDYY